MPCYHNPYILNQLFSSLAFQVMNECNNALTNMVKVGGQVSKLTNSSSSGKKPTRNGERVPIKAEEEDDYDGMLLEPDVRIGEREEDGPTVVVETDEGDDEVEEGNGGEAQKGRRTQQPEVKQEIEVTEDPVAVVEEEIDVKEEEQEEQEEEKRGKRKTK